MGYRLHPSWGMASGLMQKNAWILLLSIFFALGALVFGIFDRVHAQNPRVCYKNSKCLPEVVRIETNYDNAKVFMRDCGELCEDVVLAYSKDPTSAPSEIRITPSYDTESSLLVMNVTALDTNASYFFKIKCADERLCKEYSESYEVQTSQCAILYDILSGETQVSTCGNQNITKGEVVVASTQAIQIDTIKKYSLPVFAISSLLTIFLLLTRRNKCHKFKVRSRSIYRTKTAKA